MTTGYKFDSSIHAHTLDGIPLVGTSSVLSVLNKPGLVYWSSGLAVKEFGCPDPKILTKIKNGKGTTEERQTLANAANAKRIEISTMSTPDYIKLLDKAYRAHATNLKDTAEEGENLHAHLESFVRYRMGCTPSDIGKWHPRIEPFVKWTNENVDRFLWAETHCFSRTYHLGGISDCGFIDKQGRMGILDFKSSKSAFENHFLQIALYDLQLTEQWGGFDADGTRTLVLPTRHIDDRQRLKFDYYAVLPFGADDPKPCIRTNTEELKSVALHTLELYKYMNKQEAHD